MGYTLHMDLKDKIKDIYSTLKMDSTSDERFVKPSFRAISPEIEIRDNGTYCVFVGKHWYELR